MKRSGPGIFGPARFAVFATRPPCRAAAHGRERDAVSAKQRDQGAKAEEQDARAKT